MPILPEQRRFTRSPVDAPLQFNVKGAAPIDGIGRDISVGGMFIETASPAAFRAEIVIRVALAGSKDAVVLPAVVRWTRADGMGVQFGLLGARETHAITEIVHRSAKQ